MNLKISKYNSYLQLTACFAFLAMALLGGGKIMAQAGPAPSLLYVVDTGDGWFDHSQILQFDTAQGRILKTFNAGQDPDMALSPDGSRLYITTYMQDSDTTPLVNHLSVYDTASGKLLERIGNPDAIKHTMPAYGTALAVSPSGRWLYMTKFHFNPDKSYFWYLTAFDTVQNQFLPVQAKLPCREVTMVPMRQDLSVVLVCRDSPYVFDVNLGNYTNPIKRVPVRQGPAMGPVAGAAASKGTAIMPPQSQESWGAVFLQPGADKVALVSDSDGSVFSLDHTVGTSTQVGREPRLKSGGISKGFVSPNEDAVYFQTASSPLSRSNQSLSRRNQILSADPKTMSLKGTLTISKPFFSMVLSKDGHTIFTVNPDAATIGVVDASTFTEVRQIPAVGRRPIYAIAAP
ncbi:MAG TPA: hypothetical protein VGK21_08460 [Candidatus Angelobacter sp.]|jgi:hypothetical protein